MSVLVAFKPDDSGVAILGADNLLKLWDSTGTLQHTYSERDTLAVRYTCIALAAAPQQVALLGLGGSC